MDRCELLTTIRDSTPTRADRETNGDSFVTFFRARRLYKRIVALVASGQSQSLEAPSGVRLHALPAQVFERYLRNRDRYRCGCGCIGKRRVEVDSDPVYREWGGVRVADLRPCPRVARRDRIRRDGIGPLGPDQANSRTLIMRNGYAPRGRIGPYFRPCLGELPVAIQPIWRLSANLGTSRGAANVTVSAWNADDSRTGLTVLARVRSLYRRQ